MQFWNFIRENKQNYFYLWSTAILSIVLFTLFKISFPYPNLDFDSYHYLGAAMDSEHIGIWPAGYSIFLKIVHAISYSALFLVGIQYFVLQLSCLIFFFSFLYFFRPGKIASRVTYFFLFINPLFLYCCNFILSDAIFISLSLLWTTTLLWLIRKPRFLLLVTQAILLVLALSVRYTALYYPFVAALAIILSPLQIRLKLAGLAWMFTLVAGYVFYVSILVSQYSGQIQFSPFGGWKLANDALYVYAHTYKNQKEPVPAEFKRLDEIVRTYFDTAHSLDNLMNYESRSAGSFYIFLPKSPLQTYLNEESGNNPQIEDWIRISPFLASYGFYLIKQSPVSFLKYFMRPNACRYLFPPTENFTIGWTFTFSHDSMGKMASDWFRIRRMKVKLTYMTILLQTASYYSILFAIIHIGFILAFFGLTFFHGIHDIRNNAQKQVIIIAVLWLSDLIFCLTAAAVVLRYEFFMIIIESTFAIYYIDRSIQYIAKSPRSIE